MWINCQLRVSGRGHTSVRRRLEVPTPREAMEETRQRLCGPCPGSGRTPRAHSTRAARSARARAARVHLMCGHTPVSKGVNFGAKSSEVSSYRCPIAIRIFDPSSYLKAVAKQEDALEKQWMREKIAQQQRVVDWHDAPDSCDDDEPPTRPRRVTRRTFWSQDQKHHHRVALRKRAERLRVLRRRRELEIRTAKRQATVWAARDGILCHEQTSTWVRPSWAAGELRPNEVRARAPVDGPPRADPFLSRGSDLSRAARGRALAAATRWAALRLRARDESVTYILLRGPQLLTRLPPPRLPPS